MILENKVNVIVVMQRYFLDWTWVKSSTIHLFEKNKAIIYSWNAAFVYKIDG